MRPFLESVTERAKEKVLKETISALLNLIEDTSNFILNYMSKTTAGICIVVVFAPV